MLNTSASNLIQNGELDEATYEIKYAQIHNEKTASFNIEEYNDLEIIISMYELTLRKISTGATDEYRLKKIGFYGNLEIEILREFSCNEYFKPKVFCSMSLRKEELHPIVRNAIQDIKKLFKRKHSQIRCQTIPSNGIGLMKDIIPQLVKFYRWRDGALVLWRTK